MDTYKHRNSKIKSPVSKLFIFVVLVLLLSKTYDLVTNSSENNKLYHENVSFGTIKLNRFNYFTVKEEVDAEIYVKSNIETGSFLVTLTNPEGEEVYKYSGLHGEETVNIQLYEGDWRVHVEGENVKNGKYTIIIE